MNSSAQSKKILILGAQATGDVPGIALHETRHEFVCAPDDEALARHLPGTEVLLGWNFRNRALAENFGLADNLKWIHWGAAGVDTALFPALVASDVILTNSRGLFDRPIAEFILGYMLSEIKLFRENLKLQHEKTWQHRFNSRLAGQTAAIYGVGSIGRATARLLTAVGVKVCGIGRSARNNDADFGIIHAAGDRLEPLADADWVIGIMPGTPATTDYFDEAFFAAMKPSARFMNLGRGTAVVEDALVAALREKRIRGALLDVFRQEPLPPSSPLWDVPNLTISPHHSGDYVEYPADIAQLFFDNLERYLNGQPMHNVVDKTLGFVP